MADRLNKTKARQELLLRRCGPSFISTHRFYKANRCPDVKTDVRSGQRDPTTGNTLHPIMSGSLNATKQTYSSKATSILTVLTSEPCLCTLVLALPVITLLSRRNR